MMLCFFGRLQFTHFCPNDGRIHGVCRQLPVEPFACQQIGAARAGWRSRVAPSVLIWDRRIRLSAMRTETKKQQRTTGMRIWRANKSLGDVPCKNPGVPRGAGRSTVRRNEVVFESMNLLGVQGGIQAKHPAGGQPASRCFGRSTAAFTLTEVVISFVILVLVFHGILKAYAIACQRSEWSAHSLAAQSLAMQHMEAMRAAKWDPQNWPIVDEVGLTNYRRADILDVPAGSTTTYYATSVVAVTTVTANPPLRQIRADCIWQFKPRGFFTNTVITLRAPDQ